MMDVSEDPMWTDDFDNQIASASAPDPLGMLDMLSNLTDLGEKGKQII